MFIWCSKNATNQKTYSVFTNITKIKDNNLEPEENLY